MSCSYPLSCKIDSSYVANLFRNFRQRKELGHTQLVTEVITQLAPRFKPDIAMVKRRIEDLIVRDYLERIEDVNRNTTQAAYRYQA